MTTTTTTVVQTAPPPPAAAPSTPPTTLAVGVGEAMAVPPQPPRDMRVTLTLTVPRGVSLEFQKFLDEQKKVSACPLVYSATTTAWYGGVYVPLGYTVVSNRGAIVALSAALYDRWGIVVKWGGATTTPPPPVVPPVVPPTPPAGV